MSNLMFYGCDTVELAKEFGTPLYVMSEDAINERIQEIKNVFDNKYENAQTSYASKAFLTKDMVRIVKNANIGLDVVSVGELYLAKIMEFPMEKVSFHGNSKTRSEIETGIEYDVGSFICDSIEEIEQIEACAIEKNANVNIIIRVTPGVDSHTHKYIQTAMKDSKFGVPLSKTMEAIKLCQSSQNVSLKGFHFHVGSQLLENTSHIMAVDVLLELIKKAKEELNFVTEDFSLGGGFGIQYTENDEPIHPGDFIEPMVSKITSFCVLNDLHVPKLHIEPGRYIVGEAGVTLYTVSSVKEIPNIRTYVGIDGGMTDNIRPALYGAKYEAEVCNRQGEEKNTLVSIAGNACESSDILIYDLKAPKIKSGDVLLVKATGAYNYTMASNYNKSPIPAVVMIRNGKPYISVRRQTLEELYMRDY